MFLPFLNLRLTHRKDGIVHPASPAPGNKKIAIFESSKLACHKPTETSIDLI